MKKRVKREKSIKKMRERERLETTKEWPETILENSISIIFLNGALNEIGTVVFELLRNEFSHQTLRQNLWKIIVTRYLRELVAQERSNQIKERMYLKYIYIYVCRNICRSFGFCIRHRGPVPLPKGVSSGE